MPGQTMPGRIAPNDATREAILSKLRQARARTAEVRQALESASTPEEVGACVPLLHEAIACLQTLATAANPSPENASPKRTATPSQPELAREFAALRFELGVARRLIEGGAEFYQGWARTLAAVLSGYTPSGEPAPLTAPGSLSLQG